MFHFETMFKSSTPSEKLPLFVFELSSMAAGYRMVNEIGALSNLELLDGGLFPPGKFVGLVRGSLEVLSGLRDEYKSRFQEEWLDETLIQGSTGAVLEAYYNLNKTQLGTFFLVFQGETLSSAFAACEASLGFSNVEILDFRSGRDTGGKTLVLFTGRELENQKAVQIREKLEAIRNSRFVEFLSPLSAGLKTLYGFKDKES